MRINEEKPAFSRFYLGIDGGGTKTHIVVIDQSGEIVAEGFSGRSSIDTVDFEESMRAVKTAYRDSGFFGMVKAAFAGIGGIASADDEKRYVDDLGKLAFLQEADWIDAKNDVYGALASGSGKLQGMALILGTGSVCFGINQGKKWRTGGYHYLEGDAGSAFDVGMQALRYYARVLDGRYPKSNFSDQIKSQIEIDDFAHMVEYFSELNRTEVAKLAPIVTGFGRIDQHAYRILADAAEEVRLLAEGVYLNLGFDEADCVVIGGIGTADTLYKELYANAIRRLSTKIRLVSPQYTPAHACALLARDNYEDNHDQI